MNDTVYYDEYIYKVVENQCKQYFVAGCILYFKYFDNEVNNVIENYFMQNKINIKPLLKKKNKLIIQIFINPLVSTKITKYETKYENSIKIINVRDGGWLWHYFHFLIDCLHKEIESNIIAKNIIRLDRPDQSIGQNKTIYMQLSNKNNIELKQEIFENIYCKTKVIRSINHIGPFPDKSFDKIYKLSEKMYISSFPKYKIVLIERGTQKLKYTEKDMKNQVVVYKPNELNINCVKSGKERRYIKDHDKLHKILKDKYKDDILNIVLETLDKDMAKQITIFRNASIIIGVHGAGLANVIFCKPNTTMLEIEPIPIPCFKNIAQSKNIRYIRCRNDIQDIVQKLNRIV